MLQGGGSLSGPPAHVRATGHPLLPGTAPLLGRGPLTCTLQGPFHLHTWTLAMKTPYWRLLVGAPGSRLFTRPAADAGPWRRAAQALPACERGKGRRGGWGEGQWAGEAARSGCGR